MQKAPLALLGAGVALGGLIALSSSNGPTPLKTSGATATTISRAGTTSGDGGLAPIVDEPITAGRIADGTDTKSVLAAVGLAPQGLTTSSSTSTTSATAKPGAVAAPGQPTTSTTARTVDGRPANGSVFSLQASDPNSASSGPSTGTTTSTTTSSNNQQPSTAPPTTTAKPTTSTTAAPTTTTAKPTTTTTAKATTTTTAPPTTTTTPASTTTTTVPESAQCKNAREQLAKDQAKLEQDQANHASSGTIKRDQQRVDQDQVVVDRECGTQPPPQA